MGSSPVGSGGRSPGRADLAQLDGHFAPLPDTRRRAAGLTAVNWAGHPPDMSPKSMGTGVRTDVIDWEPGPSIEELLTMPIGELKRLAD